jgi:TnpA family transposase
MAIQILSDEQRRQYARFAGGLSSDDLARYFHLDEIDHETIRNLRGDHNRLGFALTLCGARFMGVFPDLDTGIPKPALAHLRRQLEITADVALDDYFAGTQRPRHLTLIRRKYGFTDFTDNGLARLRLTRWLYTFCWSGDDRPALLMRRAVSWLVASKVLLPGVTTLERFVGRIRDRSHRRLWRKLIDGLTQDQRARIARLFAAGDSAEFNKLDALRAPPSRRSQSEFLRHLDRLDAIRAFGLRPVPPKGVPAAVIERLARVARVGRPSAIVALTEPRRTATVAALFYTLEAAAQDDAIELAEALLIDLIKTAQAAEEKKRLRSLRDLDAAALTLAGMSRMVLADDELPLQAWREALFKKLPRAEIEAAQTNIEAIAKPEDAEPYIELRKRWRSARRLFLNATSRIEIGASPNGDAIRKAIDYLKGKAQWSGDHLRDAPTEAVGKSWRRHVLNEEGKVIDPKAYVFAIIHAWRTAVRRRDVFAQPGARYGDPRRGLLDGAAWQSSQSMICRTLNRSLDAKAELDALSLLLDTAYRNVADHVADNPDFRIEHVDGAPRLVVSPLDKLDEPASLKALRRQVQQRLPKVDLPDAILEVMQRTRFAKAFTHLSERQARVENFDASLAAVLVAKACNIGFEPLIRPGVPALSRDRLSWLSQNFIRPETIAAANAKIVAAHNALPIAKLWGTGDVVSADGMRFEAPADAIHAGPNPKYYLERGVTWYNMLSDQFSGLNATVVPGTLRDSLVILALLLEQETELEPMEIMTDTAAYSDAVFGLFWLLGYQFSPRLADIGGARLWRIDKAADYGAFNDLATGKINLPLIEQNWPDLIRLAGSLRLGHLRAAGVMRTLQVRDKPTTLARALTELGRIVKTLHILRCIDDPAFRRRILLQLNRQESRHSLGRKLFIGERGEVKNPLRQGQEEDLGVFGLVLNIITHWNAVYIQEVVRQLEKEGVAVDPADQARLSPVMWRHINFLGRYDFSLPNDVAEGRLRQLRNPNSEPDF